MTFGNIFNLSVYWTFSSIIAARCFDLKCSEQTQYIEQVLNVAQLQPRSSNIDVFRYLHHCPVTGERIKYKLSKILAFVNKSILI